MSPSACPEGTATAPCSRGLALYGRAPCHWCVQHTCALQSILLTPEHPLSPTLCWVQGCAGDSGLTTAQSRDRMAKPEVRGRGRRL